MHNINIKPLSINECFQGRRFKTKTYKQFEKDLSFLLPTITIPDGNLKLSIEWGFSNKSSDTDNPTKPFQDILQKKYGFNDSRIYELSLKKSIVKKGSEYIKFELSAIKD